MKRQNGWAGANDRFGSRLRDAWLLLITRPRLKIQCPPIADNRDLSGVFAVPDTEAWWLAVHQVLDQAERETIEGARNKITNTNMCISAIGAGEGIALVRNKLIAARQKALTNFREGEYLRKTGTQEFKKQ